MPRTDRPARSQLDINRSREDRRLPRYQRAFEQTIRHFSVETSAFKNPPAEVFDGALRLLSGYDIDTDFMIHQ